MSDSINSEEQKKVKDSFSFSKVEDGVNKSVNGREVENGWIIDIDKSWTEKDDHGNDCYQSDHKCYISKDNPLEKLKNKKNKEDDMSGMFDSILGSASSLLVS